MDIGDDTGASRRANILFAGDRFILFAERANMKMDVHKYLLAPQLSFSTTTFNVLGGRGEGRGG